MAKVSLNELFDIEVLQSVQDAFSEYTGLAAIMTDPDGVPVTKSSGFTHICMDMTRGTSKGLERCMKCDKDGAFETLRNGKPCVYKCHAGLCDFAAPIMLDDAVIGCFIGGQAAYEPIDDEKFRVIASDLGLDPDEYVKAAHDINFMPIGDIERAAHFLFRIAGAISLMAFRSHNLIEQSRQLERDAGIKMGYITENMTAKIQVSMDEWIRYTGEMLYGIDDPQLQLMSSLLKEKSMEIYTSVTDAVDYLKESELSADYEERVYSIPALFMEIAAAAKSDCGNKGLDFTMDIDPSAQTEMFGNEQSVSYIVEKLITNAVRYTANGGVTVSVSVEKVNYSDVLTVKVSDTGDGMIEEAVDDIRVNLAGQNISGVGESQAEKLGFTVIGMLLRKMSGSVSVESVIGKGTEFIVRVPQLAVRRENF